MLNGVKWHVTSFNTADYCFLQAKKTDDSEVDDSERVRGSAGGEHLLFLVDLPSPGVSVVRTPAYSHTISHHHPIVAFDNVRVPAANLVGAEGDAGCATRASMVPLLERLMVAARCTGAACGSASSRRWASSRRRGSPGSPDPRRTAWSAGKMLADSVTELFAARSQLLYETARAIDRDPADAEDRARAVLDGQAVLLGDGTAGSRTAPSRSSGAAATCARTWPERFFRELRAWNALLGGHEPRSSA